MDNEESIIVEEEQRQQEVQESGTKKKLGFLDKAKKSLVKALDKNDDGEFDLKDVSIVAGTIGSAAKKAAGAVKTSVKEGSEQLNQKIEQNKREAELKALAPIFSDDLEDPSFSIPKLIRVTEIDKKHAESELCQGSIGFSSLQKDLNVVTLFRDKVDEWGVSFYPDRDSEIYYVDPVDRDHYIALDEYFNYLKVVRITELQKIAQDLGAKHFRVIYKEQKKSIVANDIKGKVNAKGVVHGITGKLDASFDHSSSSKEFSSVEIAAEMSFLGHEPVAPKLVYLAKESAVQSLIDLRMSNNTMLHQTITIQLSNSSGIKVRDAEKIDAALAAMKLSGDTTVTSEAQNESRRLFEYEIDF